MISHRFEHVSIFSYSITWIEIDNTFGKFDEKNELHGAVTEFKNNVSSKSINKKYKLIRFLIRE